MGAVQMTHGRKVGVRMKIPKLIESMNWVFDIGSRHAKPGPLKCTEVSMQVEPKTPEFYTPITARLQLKMRTLVNEGVTPKEFTEIPIQLRRSLLREVYGEVVEELRDLEYEAYQHDVLFNSDLSERLGKMITILETGEA
jgi:hypothetical protein